jgi:peptide-methionine (R)-S-oxide reductase
MSFNSLTSEEKQIIEGKGTEAPFVGEYDNFYKEGIFICRKCNSPLFSSKSKFDAGCGWPAFDENFPNAIIKVLDKDGIRMEIQCTNCRGHLGHIFINEGLTEKNIRHCVNSLSIRFIPEDKILPQIITHETLI